MKRTFTTYWPYLLLALAIWLPLWTPGYILTLDAVFTPALRMPTAVASDYLWQTTLHVLNLVLPSQVIEKLIFMAIIVFSGAGMHRLIEYLRGPTKSDAGGPLWMWASYGAGILYAVNPYAYSRFMAGQYGVLLGYMLLPFFARACLNFAADPDRKHMVKLALLAVLTSIVSIPTLGELAVIALCTMGVAAWTRPKQRKRYLLLGAAAIGLFVLLSSYWLVPQMLGKGSMTSTVSQFDSAHTAAFATEGSNAFIKAVHVLRLQGFWTEARELYFLPQDRFVGWGIVCLAVWGFVAFGAVTAWRRSRRVAATFTAVLTAGVILAIGVIPLTALGYREPHKFAGLVALVFAIFLAYGVVRVLERTRERSETGYALAIIGTLVVVIMWTPIMYWGFGGQLRPRSYPPDWYTLNNRLNEDTESFGTLFLPWHEYMSFGFAGRIIASPAADFFDKPMVVSNDPELGDIKQPADDPQKTAVAEILARAETRNDLSQQLAAHDIRYILLAKEYDYRQYEYVQHQPGLVLEQDLPTLALYRNTAWKENK